MPTYEYACTTCGEHLEVVQSFRDEALTECPACGGSLRKVFGSIGVVFKGSGFYKTDSRPSSGSGDKGASSSASDAGSSKSSSSESSAASATSTGGGSSSTTGSSTTGSSSGSSGSNSGSSDKSSSGKAAAAS